jgi:phosphatidylglycerophosphate synthase
LSASPVFPGLTAWLRLQAVGWLAAIAVVAWRPPTPGADDLWPWLLGGLVLSWASLVVVLRAAKNLADAVTIARGAGICALFASASPDAAWGWWAAAVAVVASDLVDGWVARRFGGSPAGAVLDMETDQCTVLALAVLVAASGGGWHVLLLPAMRYLYVLAAAVVRVRADEPKPRAGSNTRGRRICAAVVVALLLALAPPTPTWLGDTATAIAVLLLAFSFSSDWHFLLASRRGSPA